MKGPGGELYDVDIHVYVTRKDEACASVFMPNILLCYLLMQQLPCNAQRVLGSERVIVIMVSKAHYKWQ